MKKIVLIALLLAVGTAACVAQEARQDISLSGTAIIEPFIEGTTNVYVSANRGFGALMSYRFMLTPSSALEANYGIDYRNVIHYVITNTNNYLINTRTQEISAAYVRYFVYKNFNPFLEGGPAAFIFLPIVNSGTTNIDTTQQTQIGAIFGAGIAYELSPSWDLRVEYRGMVTKVPTFGQSEFVTNRWYPFNIYNPVIGLAYHF
jgi:opacity protein-like surface antigen